MLRSLLFLLLLAGSTAVQADAAFLYLVRVDAAGQMRAIEPVADVDVEPMSAAVAAALREQLLQRRYVRADGRGGTLSTWLAGRYIASPDGADVAITALRAGPRVLQLDPPKFGRDALDPGFTVTLRLKCGADGRAAVVAIDGLDRLPGDVAQRFRTRIRAAVERWRFQPERWDGRPVETGLSVVLGDLPPASSPGDPIGADVADDQPGPLRVPAAEFRPLRIPAAAR
jgi:hypothetical protein